jgi:hypothetical protein
VVGQPPDDGVTRRLSGEHGDAPRAVSRSGIRVEIRRVRLILRVLVFAIVTFATGVALWFVLLSLGPVVRCRPRSR